jgi:predicted O-methyltransferase YrrM
MFFLLLESMLIYGNIDNNTHILVYTSTTFMNLIKKSHLYNGQIIFEINDTYNTVHLACKSRLDLFNLSSITNYNKILYLDTDIIIKDDINKVFDVCKEDLLYVLEEGSIDSDTDFWGKTLFDNEIDNYLDKTAFTSGILLFNNCEKIKDLFNKIIEDMKNREHYFHDQPFIVYNAFKYDLYNNKTLKSTVVNNNYNVHSNKIIHHFPGNPGVHEHKIGYMIKFLNELKDYNIHNYIYRTQKYIHKHLANIINNSGEQIDETAYMLYDTNMYSDDVLNKTKNISNLVLNKNIKHVLVIGFNTGFSTLLMLLSNPSIDITCIDAGIHSYTMPCYLKLKETFGDRINIVIGNISETLPNVKAQYDLIYIDGGDSTEIAESDINYCYRLSKNNTIILMDDYDSPYLRTLWGTCIGKYNLKPLHINLYDCPHHTIKYVVK